jgi:6-phosphogluconolactonase
MERGIKVIKKILFLCGLSALAACGGGGGSGDNALGSGGGGSSSSASSVGKFIYVANFGSNSISAYAINATTGGLTPVGGSPFTTGASNNVVFLAAHPSVNFLFATNYSSLTVSGSISAFTINSTTGALSLTSGSPYSVGMPSAPIAPDAPIFHPDGKYIYVRQSAESKIYGFALNQTSGVLTPTVDSPLPSAPFAGKFNGITKFYYVPLVSPSNAMGIVAVDIVTGVGTLLGSVTESQPLGFPVFDATNKYMYASSVSRLIYGYSVNTTDGSIAKLPGSPYQWPAAQTAVTNLPGQVLVHPSGKFVYVLDPNTIGITSPLGNANITVYSVDQTTGSLSAVGTPVSTGGNFGSGMQIYKNGHFLLVTNRLSSSVAIFGINQTTGALTPAVNSPFSTPGAAPGIVVVDPSGKFAYLTDSLSNRITEFTIDASAGTITVGPNYPTGPTPSSLPLIVGLQ